MLIGLSALKAVLAEGNLKSFSKLNSKYFIDREERKAYKRITEYVSKYGQLPPESFIETEAEVDNHPLSYYLEELVKRYKGYKLSEIESYIKNIGDENPDKALNYIQEVLLDCNISDVSAYTEESLLDILSEDIENLRINSSREGLVGIPTGWQTLNRVTGGYTKGDVIVFSARAKMGKTMLMIYSSSMAMSLGYKVLFISMEMTKEQILRRLVALRAGINTSVFRTGEITSFVEHRLMDELDRISDKFILVEGQLSRKFSEVITLIKIHNPDIVFIDGAYLIRGSHRYNSLWEEVGDVIKNIKTVAITSNLPIVCSYQLNRVATKKREGLGLEHIALADAIGQIASCVIGIVDADVPLQKKIEIIATRDGETDDFFINWDWERMNFTEIIEEGGIESHEEAINRETEEEIDPSFEDYFGF